MGWIVVGILLFAVLAAYAVFMLQFAVMSIAMDGARKKPRTGWSVLGVWLIMMAFPLWGPIFWLSTSLGIRIPLLKARFSSGGRRRSGEEHEPNDVQPGDDLP